MAERCPEWVPHPCGFQGAGVRSVVFFFASPVVLILSAAPPDALPFAAPNSHSTPKIHHSLTFALLRKNTDATVPHGRPDRASFSPPVFPFQSFPPANLLRACPSGSRASAPSFLQRPIVVLPSAPLNSRPLILLQTLCRCEKSQPLWNQANPNSFAKTRGGIPPEAAQTFSGAHGVSVANPFLSSICRLFALFFHLPCFVFSNLGPLFPNYRGWGIPNALTGHPACGVLRACIETVCIAD